MLSVPVLVAAILAVCKLYFSYNKCFCFGSIFESSLRVVFLRVNLLFFERRLALIFFRLLDLVEFGRRRFSSVSFSLFSVGFLYFFKT